MAGLCVSEHQLLAKIDAALTQRLHASRDFAGLGESATLRLTLLPTFFKVD